MNILDELSFGFGNKLPLILQTEATECSLACLGMIAGYHGHKTDIASLRRQFSISLKGVNLALVIQFGKELGLESRPLRAELTSLKNLKTPCILHWEFNHFVVLKSIERAHVIIHDPAFGLRRLTFEEVSNAFTGVALELWPSQEFQHKDDRSPRLRLLSLLEKVTGLKSLFVQIIMLAMALEIFALLSPIFTQLVVDNVLLTGDHDLLTTLALGFGLVMLISQAITAMRSWMILYMGTTINVQWRANVLSHLLKLPVGYFLKRHLGDVLSRFGSIDQIQQTLTTSFLAGLLDGLMTVVTLIMMFIYSWKLALVALLAMCLYAALRVALYRPLRGAIEAQIVEGAKQNSYFLETVRGIATIKLFQREDVRRMGWLSHAISQTNAGLRAQRLQLVFQTANGILFGLERIAVMWIGALMIMAGNFSVGVLMAFVMYKEQFDSRVASLIDKYYQVKMLRIQADRLSDIVLSEPERIGCDALLRPTAVEPRIELRDVRFRYGENDPFVLNGVTAEFSGGETIAIVGPSGCGKTTLMNILVGTLTPSEGEVLIGGTDTKNLPLATVRSFFGTVSQDDALFAGSIADNICFFDDHPDQDRIEECAHLAAIHADIAAMPMGYRTLVGDMGSALSGGQKQRVLIARALYKRPKILVLDEATSHLDVDNEREVNDAIKSLRITRIIIAHRPETIASADRVIALSNGIVPAAPPLPKRQEGLARHTEEIVGII